MAQLSKPAIPVKMYRHFALVTFGLTACLAVLAQGSNQSAADELAAPPSPAPSAAPRASATPRYGQAEFRQGNSVETSNGFGADDGPTGPVRTGGGRSSQYINSSMLPAEGSENAGFTREYLDSLSDEELSELLRQLQAGGVDDPARRRQALAVIETSSRRRSGRAASME